MKKAPLPKNEQERLKALYSYEILDTEFEKEFDELVKLASHICNTPISLVSLISENRQWFKAKLGLDFRETDRDIAFCAHAIPNNDLMIVENATEDERFFDNPLVTESPDIKFYAGIPLTTPEGFNLGTLCVMDNKPGSLDEVQKQALKTLAAQVITQLELRIKIKKLAIEKKKVSRKNKDIMESIFYAERIQKAMLPSNEVLVNYFEDYFILNRPRDIIGGDFYWATEIVEKNLKIFVLADSTGHGVPGALMSMLGSALLQDIINKRKIIEVHQILKILDIGITKALNQKNNDNRDGMDISVVCIDEKKQKLTFAGANHKMVYIKGEEVNTVAGTKKGVGGNMINKDLAYDFTEIEFLEGNINFYLFTDGIYDQFGGERKQKFLRHRFTNLLKNIQEYPFEEQKKQIEKTILDWINLGDETQTDDILMIGFRPKSNKIRLA